MKRLITTLFFAAVCFLPTLNAEELTLKKGFVQAHTEVFGDGDINPECTAFITDLSIAQSPKSLRGTITMQTLDLISDNESRDEHMHQLLEAKNYKTITFALQEAAKTNRGYELTGSLTLHGITNEVTTTAELDTNGDVMRLQGAFAIKLTDYGMKPPKLLFFSVRNRIDLTYDFTFAR